MSDKSTSASGKYFIFDTNIWMKTNLMRSSVGSALILNIDLASAKIGLPEVVREETMQNLIHRGLEHAERIHDSWSAICRIAPRLDDDWPYVPDEKSLRSYLNERWEKLSPIIELFPTKPQHTMGAYRRVLKREAPNGPKDQQFKDSVIWECLLDLAEHSEVIFISADKGFYEGRRYEHGLARNLATELEEEGRSIRIHPDVSIVSAELEQSIPTIDFEKLKESIVKLNCSRWSESASEKDFEIGDRTDFELVTIPLGKTSELALQFSVEFNLNEVNMSRMHERLKPYLRTEGEAVYNIENNSIQTTITYLEIAWYDLTGDWHGGRTYFRYIKE